MNWFQRFFSRMGSILRAVIGFVERELTPERQELAIRLYRMAEAQFSGMDGLTRQQLNDQKREWVVGRLMASGLPEWLARTAVEFASKAIKERLA